MSFKKSAAFLLSLGMIFSLASCGDEPAPQKETSEFDEGIFTEIEENTDFKKLTEEYGTIRLKRTTYHKEFGEAEGEIIISPSGTVYDNPNDLLFLGKERAYFYEGEGENLMEAFYVGEAVDEILLETAFAPVYEYRKEYEEIDEVTQKDGKITVKSHLVNAPEEARAISEGCGYEFENVESIISRIVADEETKIVEESDLIIAEKGREPVLVDRIVVALEGEPFEEREDVLNILNSSDVRKITCIGEDGRTFEKSFPKELDVIVITPYAYENMIYADEEFKNPVEGETVKAGSEDAVIYLKSAAK